MARKKPKSKLRAFLLKKIQKSKIKVPDSAPDPPSPPRSSCRRTTAIASATTSSSEHHNEAQDGEFGEQGVDSLFGEALDTPSIKEQELQAHRAQFLAANAPKPSSKKFTESSSLQDLRKQLLVLVETGGNTTGKERILVEKRKGSLIEEVRIMERNERSAYEDERTKNMEFPAPLTPGEKRKLESKRKRYEKLQAEKRLGISSQPKITRAKRTRDEIDADNELDGEDRLKLGLPLKKSTSEFMGSYRNARPS